MAKQHPASKSSPGQPKRSKKKLLIVLGSGLGVLLMLGGLAIFLVINNIKNKPENILAESLYNQFFDPVSPAELKGQLKFDINNEPGAPSQVLLDFEGLGDGDSLMLDLGLKSTALSLSPSIFADGQTGKLYVKANDLQDILASGLGEEFGIPTELNSTINKISGMWVGIDPANLVAPDELQAYLQNYDDCTQHLKSIFNNQRYKASAKSAYFDNRLVVIKSMSNVKADNQNLLKFELSLDMVKVKSFIKQLDTSTSYSHSDLLQKCGPIYAGLLDSPLGEFKNTSTTLWVDKASRQVRRIESSTERHVQGARRYGVSLDLSVAPTDKQLEAPSDSIDFNKVLELLSLDPSQLQL